jgi:hypothetical protein
VYGSHDGAWLDTIPARCTAADHCTESRVWHRQIGGGCVRSPGSPDFGREHAGDFTLTDLHEARCHPKPGPAFAVVSEAGAGTAKHGRLSRCGGYVRGTFVLTMDGEIPVEALRIGDMLRAASGVLRPVKWIGRRSYGGRFMAKNPALVPVVIRVGALGDGIPRRNLLVSPSHALFIDGMLIEAADLINGESIVRAEPPAAVEYVHIELDKHDVIVADGACAETFVDEGNRGMFHNAAEFAALYPHARRSFGRLCAPLVRDGAALSLVRQCLASRLLAHSADDTPRLPLRGHVDTARHDRIEGWARDEAAPNRPVELLITDNARVIARVIADQYRPDLEACGIGEGRHAFCYDIPGGLARDTKHLIEVVCVSDGQGLAGSPVVLSPPRAFPCGMDKDVRFAPMP